MRSFDFPSAEELPGDDVFSIEELAQILGVEISILVSLERAGALAFEYRTSDRFIRRCDVERFLADVDNGLPSMHPWPDRRSGIDRRLGFRESIDRRLSERRIRQEPNSPRRRSSDFEA